MAVTTRGGVTVPDLDARDEIDPAIAAHEARHAAAALLLGLEVREARADDPNPEMRGYVMLGRYSELRPRESAIMTLAGRWGDAGWPPKRPSKLGSTFDERDLADEVETLGQGERGYELLVADTRHLVSTLEFKELAEMLELFLARGCVLRKAHLEDMHRVVVGDTKLEHKSLKTRARTGTELGQFSAIAAAYSIDRDGDQIVRGAFRNTIERWRASGKRIPLHWNHSPVPKDIVGSIDPDSMREIDDGLYVRGKLDIAKSDNARDVWELVKSSVVSLSFGYLATDKATREDGVQELRELDLFEISLVSAPANADTRILSYKSADTAEPHPAYTKQESELREHQMLSGLFAASYPTRPVEGDPVEREEKRQMRELRLELDRFRLEESLGFDTDLIKRPEA
jgi:Escherichia/Staphylococcus phage prohead protease